MTETGICPQIVECPNINKTRWRTSKWFTSSFYRLRSATEALLSWQWKNNFQMIFILTFASLLFNSLKKKEKKNILCIKIHKDSAHICSKHPQEYQMWWIFIHSMLFGPHNQKVTFILTKSITFVLSIRFLSCKACINIRTMIIDLVSLSFKNCELLFSVTFLFISKLLYSSPSLPYPSAIRRI